MAITKASDLAKLLADGVVGTTEIGDGQITTAKIADSAITTDKLASNAVTAAQLSVSGDDIPYDNSVSGMSANTLQEAIDYLNVVTGGGSAGAQATYTRDAFTATDGQTTFTTSNGYTLGYVQVFMNGVLLALTDYVANNETTVVLNVGASAGDEIVIVAYDSFAISEVLRTLNISASFPDDGITLDANGSLVVGTTVSPTTLTSTSTVNGFAYDPTVGYAVVSRAGMTTTGQNVMYLNRSGVDGSILELKKDGATVGSIATNSGRIAVCSGDRGLAISGATDAIFPTDSTGNASTNALSLGTNGLPFKDLYLSGGVYLGGTGSANHLDDYEEGTWTPYFLDGGVACDATASNIEGHYTKIGRIVIAHLRWAVSSKGTSTGTLGISLPFAVGDVMATTAVQGGCSVSWYSGVTASHAAFYSSPWEGYQEVRFGYLASSTSTSATALKWSNVSGTSFDGRMTVVYMVA